MKALKKAKSGLGTASAKAKAKVDDTKAKMDEAAVKQVDDFMNQMKILGPVMKDSGFKLIDISLIIQLTPAISCTVENVDDEKYWNDERLDESELNKTGKIIVWALKKADKAKKQFKEKSVRFSSFTFECTISPSLTLSFTPRKLKQEENEENEENKESKEEDTSFIEFLKFYNLTEYESKLFDVGAESLNDLKELSDDDIAELCEQTAMKLLHKKKFMKACGALKDGSYPPVK